MEETTLIEHIINAYRAARNPIFSHPKLTRGESRSVASAVEDIFSFYLVSRYPKINEVFINQTITSTTKGAAFRLKPDIMICQNNSIELMIDLKTDLGYTREGFLSSLRERERQVRKLRGHRFSIQKRVGEGRKHLELTAVANLKYVFVTVTDQNISSPILDKIEALASNQHNTALFILLRGIHPNVYGLSLKSSFKKVVPHISKRDFNGIDALVREALF